VAGEPGALVDDRDDILRALHGTAMQDAGGKCSDV
jgi:hypothetical protein